MKLVQFISGYTKLFYMLGQSSYTYYDGISIMNGNHKLRYKIWNYVPSVVLLAVTTILTMVTYIFMADFSLYNTLSYPVIAMNASTQLLTVIVSVCQSIFLSPYFAELFSQIRVVDQLEFRKFSIDLPAFRSALLKRFILTCTSYLLALTLTFIVKPLTWDNAVVFMCLFLLRSFTVLVVYHMLFYINLFDSIICAFVQYVKRQATTTTTTTITMIHFQDGDVQNLLSEFHFIRFMHLHISEISQTINNLFGWSLVVICLQYFLYAVYCVYFSLILIVDEAASVAQILRNLHEKLFHKTYAKLHSEWRSLQ